jgi:hypothetical protein
MVARRDYLVARSSRTRRALTMTVDELKLVAERRLAAMASAARGARCAPGSRPRAAQPRRPDVAQERTGVPQGATGPTGALDLAYELEAAGAVVSCSRWRWSCCRRGPRSSNRTSSAPAPPARPGAVDLAHELKAARSGGELLARACYTRCDGARSA